MSFNLYEKHLPYAGEANEDGVPSVYRTLQASSMLIDNPQKFIVDPELENIFEGLVGVEVTDEHWLKLAGSGLTRSRLQKQIVSVVEIPHT